MIRVRVRLKVRFRVRVRVGVRLGSMWKVTHHQVPMARVPMRDISD